MGTLSPAVAERVSRKAARGHLIRELERQIEVSHLPRTLDDAVLAQFSKSGDPEEPGCSLFGITTLYTFDAAAAAEWRVALPLAAAVEFAAAAASVLDDIQDLDPVKGIDPGVPGADAELLTLLLVLSQNAVDSVDQEAVPIERVEASRRLIHRFELLALAGQHEANSCSTAAGAGIRDALETTSAKSGSFGRLAAETGAALATDETRLIGRLGEFGWHLAVVDQLQNDVAAIWPKGERSTDLDLARETPPISFALHVPQGLSEAADQARSTILQFDATRESFAREALFSSGAIHFCWIMAAMHYTKAQCIAREEKSRDRGSRLEDLLRP